MINLMQISTLIKKFDTLVQVPLGQVTALRCSHYIEIYNLPDTIYQTDSESVPPPLTSDLGKEETPEMLLNTFSWFMEIVSLGHKVRTSSERGLWTNPTRLTSSLPDQPSPKKPEASEPVPERTAAVRGGGQRGDRLGETKEWQGPHGKVCDGSSEDHGKAAAVSGSTPVSSRQQSAMKTYENGYNIVIQIVLSMFLYYVTLALCCAMH